MTLRNLIILIMIGIFASSCEKNTNPVSTQTSENATFQSQNIKSGAVFFSFEEKQAVTPWDVQFMGVGYSPDFYLNGMKMANTMIRIYQTAETDINAVSSLPDDSLFTIDADSSIMGGHWYNYDITTHTMSSKGLVYIVETATGNYAKFRIDDYNNNVFTISYALYDATSSQFGSVSQVDLDKTDGPIHFSFEYGVTADSNDWEVKMCIVPTYVPEAGFTLNFPAILLNQQANVQAVVVSDQDFDAVDPTTLSGWQSDVNDQFIIGADWFDYDQNSHLLNSKDLTYVVKNIGGGYTKFRVLNYYNDSGASGYMTIEYQVVN